MYFCPNYDKYKEILLDILKTKKYKDYTDAKTSDEFIILRHDVEFSVIRAYKMSLIESQYGIKSSYFFQIENNSYNLLSKENKDMIKDMKLRGHHIGLHYHLNGENNSIKVRDGIRDQLRIMQEMLGFKIDRFSIHRPVKEVYYYDIHIDGVINAYSKEYFTFSDNPNNDNLSVKYIADSQYRWNYGYPDLTTLNFYQKIQLLIHADFWSDSENSSTENFLNLIKENTNSFINTLDNETKHFQKVINKSNLKVNILD